MPDCKQDHLCSLCGVYAIIGDNVVFLFNEIYKFKLNKLKISIRFFLFPIFFCKWLSFYSFENS